MLCLLLHQEILIKNRGMEEQTMPEGVCPETGQGQAELLQKHHHKHTQLNLTNPWDQSMWRQTATVQERERLNKARDKTENHKDHMIIHLEQDPGNNQRNVTSTEKMSPLQSQWSSLSCALIYGPSSWFWSVGSFYCQIISWSVHY